MFLLHLKYRVNTEGSSQNLSHGDHSELKNLILNSACASVSFEKIVQQPSFRKETPEDSKVPLIVSIKVLKDKSVQTSVSKIVDLLRVVARFAVLII